MRPLYLVFENTDELGDLVRIIFKNGDGECESIKPRTSVAVPTRQSSACTARELHALNYEQYLVVQCFACKFMYFDLSFTKVLLMQNLAKLEIRNILIFVVVYKVQNMLFQDHFLFKVLHSLCINFTFGDFVDLRQDMLTLQLFKIMDRIWQNEGLDLGFVISELQKYTGRKLATECSVLKAKEVNDITSPITHCEHPTRIQTLVSSYEIATSANLQLPQIALFFFTQNDPLRMFVHGKLYRNDRGCAPS